MPEALALVKRELGPEAVILGTRTLPAGRLGRLVSRDQVEITAIPGSSGPGRACSGQQAAANATQPRRSSTTAPGLRSDAPPAIPEQVYPYYVRLVQQELGEELARRVLESALARMPRGARPDSPMVDELLRETLASMIPTAGPGESRAGQTRRIAFVGPPGAGKTTALAKLAAHLRLRQKKAVAMLSLDMHRLAAGEQLRHYADLIRVPMAIAQTLAGVEQALKEFGGISHILIDTPGVGLREDGRFARMAALLRAARPDEIHLVLSGSTSPAVQLRLGEAFAPLGVSRVVVTRLDEAI
jgi:flagellar biosynthesis protein FlhF